MTQSEVAKAMGISVRSVRNAEASAMAKLRKSPLLFLLWAEGDDEQRSNDIGTLTRDEQYVREEI